MYYDVKEYVIGAVIGLIVVAALAGAIMSGLADAKKWAAYKAERHCVERGYTEGQTHVGYGMTANGKMGTVVTTTPRQTRWVCDGGIEIYR